MRGDIYLKKKKNGVGVCKTLAGKHYRLLIAEEEGGRHVNDERESAERVGCMHHARTAGRSSSKSYRSTNDVPRLGRLLPFYRAVDV